MSKYDVLGAWLLGIVLGIGIGASMARGDALEINGPHSELHLLSLDRFAMEHYHLINYRDPYYAAYGDEGSNKGETWHQGAAVLFDIDLVKYREWGLYMTNRVHGESTDKQFRSTGWQYEVGARWTDYVDVYWGHHSRHVLDDKGNGAFPLENIVGIRATFYKRDR